MFFSKILLIFCGIILLSGCVKKQNTHSLLDKIKERDSIIIGTNFRLPHLGFLDLATGELTGLEPDLGRLIAKYILGSEDKAEFVILTHPTRLTFLEDNIVDLAIDQITITPERELKMDFSQPYLTDWVSIFTKKELSIKDLTSLNGQKVGVVTSSTMIDYLNKYSPQAQIKIFDNTSDLADAMNRGNIDATINLTLFLYSFRFLITEPENFEVIRLKTIKEQEGIAIPKGQTELVSRVNAILDMIKNNGEWEKIYEKNIGTLLD